MIWLWTISASVNCPLDQIDARNKNSSKQMNTGDSFLEVKLWQSLKKSSKPDEDMISVIS